MVNLTLFYLIISSFLLIILVPLTPFTLKIDGKKMSKRQVNKILFQSSIIIWTRYVLYDRRDCLSEWSNLRKLCYEVASKNSPKTNITNIFVYYSLKSHFQIMQLPKIVMLDKLLFLFFRLVNCSSLEVGKG